MAQAGMNEEDLDVPVWLPPAGNVRQLRPETQEREALVAAAKTLPVLTFQDAVANLDAADFVEDVLIEGGLSVVYGQSNAGKTFWVTDLGFHVAAGIPWNGKEVTQGVVLYLALEGSYGIKNRIAAFKLEHGYEDQNLPFVVVTMGLDLLHPEADMDAVIATAHAVAKTFEAKLLLVVVDTVMRAIAGGNENSSEDMGALVRNLDTIRQETGAHVMGIHHSGKDEAKGARGWSGLRGAIDTEIEVKAESDTKTAEVVKQRDLPKGDIFSFSLKVVVLGKNTRGKDVTSCVVEPSENQAAGAASDRRRSLKGHTKRALDVLVDLIGQSGQPGHGVPHGIPSVPEKWWRERFYESAMAGADPKVKQNAFRRAADLLVEQFVVGMRTGRVWVVSKQFDASFDTSRNTSE